MEFYSNYDEELHPKNVFERFVVFTPAYTIHAGRTLFAMTVVCITAIVIFAWNYFSNKHKLEGMEA